MTRDIANKEDIVMFEDKVEHLLDMYRDELQHLTASAAAADSQLVSRYGSSLRGRVGRTKTKKAALLHDDDDHDDDDHDDDDHDDDDHDDDDHDDDDEEEEEDEEMNSRQSMQIEIAKICGPRAVEDWEADGEVMRIDADKDGAADDRAKRKEHKKNKKRRKDGDVAADGVLDSVKDSAGEAAVMVVEEKQVREVMRMDGDKDGAADDRAKRKEHKKSKKKKRRKDGDGSMLALQNN